MSEDSCLSKLTKLSKDLKEICPKDAAIDKTGVANVLLKMKVKDIKKDLLKRPAASITLQSVNTYLNEKALTRKLVCGSRYRDNAGLLRLIEKTK